MKRMNSCLEFLPAPSAMFVDIEIAVLLSRETMP